MRIINDVLVEKKNLEEGPNSFSRLPKYKGEYICIFYFIKFFYGVGISVPVNESVEVLLCIFFLVFFVTL
ncbi:MAG: hypothetical protein ACD_78C00440G0002 [uncultured bacterium (gcode 4)]|uniref:Uncharacterized protein n=1 Tax=uncultured bacterium (gcode 4) TaxID=1234023 RepID=K1XWL4_9BACT|nr:MAG: hypothetical protein ACD_78C00440G0002 [uncultured bacterium (gcode 4)]